MANRFQYIKTMADDDYVRLRHNRKPKTEYHSTFGLHYFWNSGTQTIFSTWPVTNKFVSTLSGVSDPNWKAKVKAGLDATNQMSATRRGFSVLSSGGTEYLIRQNLGSNFPFHRELFIGVKPDLNFVPANHPVGTSITKAEQIAVKRLYAAIRECQTQISGPTFLGELRESIKMIRRPHERMLKLTDDFLSAVQKYVKAGAKLPKSLRRDYIAKQIAGAYLQLSFGWKPLINDVRDAAVAVSRISNDIRRGRVRGYGEDEMRSSFSNYEAPFGSYVGMKTTFAAHSTVKVIYRAGVDTDLLFPKNSLEAVRQLCGFKFQEFVPTLWELLPWSWLIDYVTNVGDVLAFAFTDTSFVYRVHRTVVTETRWQNNCSLVSLVPKDYLITQNGDGTFGSTEVVLRDVTRAKSALPNLALTFKLPSSLGQLANIAAALVQRGGAIQATNRGL